MSGLSDKEIERNLRHQEVIEDLLRDIKKKDSKIKQLENELLRLRKGVESLLEGVKYYE